MIAQSFNVFLKMKCRPYGWKKVGHRRADKEHWDFYVFAPNGKKLRSKNEIKKFLERNPSVKCDLDVTNTSSVKNSKQSKLKKVTATKAIALTATAPLQLLKAEFEKKTYGRKRNNHPKVSETNQLDQVTEVTDVTEENNNDVSLDEIEKRTKKQKLGPNES